MKKEIPKFEIDEEYLNSITVHKVFIPYDGKMNLTSDELLEVLRYDGHQTSISSKDHPKFTELREELERLGYIKIERAWWNGDSVLKPFKLNDLPFKKHDQFSCAAALGIRLTLRKTKNVS